MFTQLATLSEEIEGRYASDQELQFLEDYLASVATHIQAYEKIRDNAEAIMEQVEAEKRDRYPHLFQQNGRDIREICRRDLTNILRMITTSMLLGEMARLREGCLIWYQTLVRAFEYTSYAQINYRLIQDAVKVHLSSEEMALMKPGLQLAHTILGS